MAFYTQKKKNGSRALNVTTSCLWGDTYVQRIPEPPVYSTNRASGAQAGIKYEIPEEMATKAVNYCFDSPARVPYPNK